MFLTTQELEGDISKVALPTNLSEVTPPRVRPSVRPCVDVRPSVRPLMSTRAAQRAHVLAHSVTSLRPGRLLQSIRLRLDGVDATLNLLLKVVAVMGGSVTLKALTPVWGALKAVDSAEGRRGAEEGEPVTEVIQRGVKQRLLKYLAASGSSSGAPRTRRKSSAAGTEGRWACHPGLRLAVFLLSTCKQNSARY